MTLLPPSTFLPSFKAIPTCSPDALSKHVSALKGVYTPDVRGSEPMKTEASELEVELNGDPFERSHSVRWLTSLIALSDSWVAQRDGDSYMEVLQEASQLLALLSDPSTTSNFTRRFTFSLAPAKDIEITRFIELPPCVEITLQDVSIDSQDFTSVGNQTWGGSYILAEMIAKNPYDFLSKAFNNQIIKVLELGAGTGLVSLTVGKILSSISSDPGEVLATDFHPAVLRNLCENAKRNSLDIPHPILKIESLDWSAVTREHPTWLGRFDLILGADIVYEIEHATWIKTCVENCLVEPAGEALLRQPSFHLIVPLRRTHRKETETIEAVFARVNLVHDSSKVGRWTLGILSKNDICRQAHSNDREIVVYRHYRIGWGTI